jgi:hypothetical protein
MGRTLVEEVATLASLALFLGMVAIWAQVIATLWVIAAAMSFVASGWDRRCWGQTASAIVARRHLGFRRPAETTAMPTDCVAGHVGLELRNVDAKIPNQVITAKLPPAHVAESRQSRATLIAARSSQA